MQNDLQRKKHDSRVTFEHIFAIDWAPASHYLPGLHPNHALIYSGHSSVTLPGSSWRSLHSSALGPPVPERLFYSSSPPSSLLERSLFLSLLIQAAHQPPPHRISHQESSLFLEMAVCWGLLTPAHKSWLSHSCESPELVAKPAMTKHWIV